MKAILASLFMGMFAVSAVAAEAKKEEAKPAKAEAKKPEAKKEEAKPAKADTKKEEAKKPEAKK